MNAVEPVPGEPAAVGSIAGDRVLFVADYHAGIEAALRYERGVQVPSRADDRRERLCNLLARTDADRLVVLGDLMHSIGDPGGAERGEIEVLFESLPPIPVTLVKGNHDGAIESWLRETIDDANRGRPGSSTGATDLTVLDGDGGRLGSIGVCHGHSWPAAEAVEADILCFGHEHPCVRLEDDVGGSRVEPVWFRGTLDRPGISRWAKSTHDPDEAGERPEADPLSVTRDSDLEFVVFPAFNELAGGTWINVDGQSFLSPMLPDWLRTGDAYLLDGTRLGAYDSI